MTRSHSTTELVPQQPLVYRARNPKWLRELDVQGDAEDHHQDEHQEKGSKAFGEDFHHHDIGRRRTGWGVRQLVIRNRPPGRRRGTGGIAVATAAAR
jgi:hypothetical protein